MSNPQRRQLRCHSYDYSSSGAYFCTICTHARNPYFEHPILRSMLEIYWSGLPERYPGLQLDSFTIMPDHVHCIVWLHTEGPGSVTLGKVIGGYKSLVCVTWLQYIKTMGLPYPGPLWQRGYHDHVIRDEDDLLQKQVYIQNNPIKFKMMQEGKHRMNSTSHKQS